tara:strand:- start:13 stop:192 length:180 start_codon:yes stop_codon:yes gene_type:complete
MVPANTKEVTGSFSHLIISLPLGAEDHGIYPLPCIKKTPVANNGKTGMGQMSEAAQIDV